MLTELHIKNFAIIEDVSVQFKSGMTTLTGETGAGKSMIIDAVGLIVGGRGSSDFVRHGAVKCVLEGTFKVEASKSLQRTLEEHAIELADGFLAIQREIYATGRNVCRVNGSMVTISVLKEIGAHLIDIHGQNEHQELMQADRHIHLLDYFGRETLDPLLEKYHTTYQRYKELRTQWEEFQTAEQASAQRLDMYRFQIQEIETAELMSGEEEALIEEEKTLSHVELIREVLGHSYYLLQEGEVSALDQLGEAMNELERIAELGEDYANIHSQLSDAFYVVQDLASEIYAAENHLQSDDGRLEEIIGRLNTIRQLKRKYGTSVEDVLSYLAEIKEKYEYLASRDDVRDDLSAKVVRLEQEALAIGCELSEQRRGVAVHLEEKIKEQLQDLYMGKTQFNVHFQSEMATYESSDLGPNGLDRVEFYVSTNPGEPLKPLTRVASGGELSRLMLALKSIFSKAQGITSVIFDEVDTGVSGRVAQAIADKMHKMATNSQVLAVSHLPQVAAAADHQLYVKKQVIDGGKRTVTAAKRLDRKERVAEVARMLSGKDVTATSQAAAKELLTFNHPDFFTK